MLKRVNEFYKIPRLLSFRVRKRSVFKFEYDGKLYSNEKVKDNEVR